MPEDFAEFAKEERKRKIQRLQDVVVDENERWAHQRIHRASDYDFQPQQRHLGQAGR